MKRLKFLNPIGVSAAKHEMEVFNSKLARGEIKNPEEIVRLHHIKCGCGSPTCIFIHAQRK
jgi:hypothetical protein